jgi:hypothetical protein
MAFSGFRFSAFPDFREMASDDDGKAIHRSFDHERHCFRSLRHAAKRIYLTHRDTWQQIAALLHGLKRQDLRDGDGWIRAR